MSNEKKPAIVVSHISKSFRIPLDGSTGIKQKIVNGLTNKKGYRNFTPLNDVSFTIEEGEFFGIVGRNGSGKSTLLKTMAGIYTPDGGYVKVNGTLVPFIELGVGFNPELTGRENVYLNGALLGFSRDEMGAMYEEIVDFAELHEFMEEHLKNYSSGMQVRLAFSIAIRARGDILLLDEVLAVGDAAFQKKCVEYFEELKQNNKTVILVTHDMSAVESFCDKALFLENGKVELIGKPHEIANAYTRSNDRSYKKSSSNYRKFSTSDIDITLRSDKGVAVDTFTTGQYMFVDFSWQAESVNHVGVAIFNKKGQYMYGTNTYRENKKPLRVKHASYKVKLDMAEGNYFLKVGLFGETDNIQIDFEENGSEFMINRDMNDTRWEGLVPLESEWL